MPIKWINNAGHVFAILLKNNNLKYGDVDFMSIIFYQSMKKNFKLNIIKRLYIITSYRKFNKSLQKNIIYPLILLRNIGSILFKLLNSHFVSKVFIQTFYSSVSYIPKKKTDHPMKEIVASLRKIFFSNFHLNWILNLF